MACSNCQLVLFCAVGLLLLARPAAAFGAGNIASMSKVEGVNWRHGDIEDALLTIAAAKAMSGKKFGKLDVKRVSLIAAAPERNAKTDGKGLFRQLAS